jgi:hypothetical protein
MNIDGLKLKEFNRPLLQPLGYSVRRFNDGERTAKRARTRTDPYKREKDWRAYAHELTAIQCL